MPIFGIDVSHWQKNVNMEKVAAHGAKFVMVKAGELYMGRDYRDAYYVQNITNARAAGLITGAYYFFRPSSPLTAQRRMFREMWELAPADLPPIIDVEAADAMTPGQIKNAFEHFYKDVANTWGRKPIVYSRDNLVGAWKLQDYVTDPLYYWKALYSNKFEGRPAKFWQFSDKYRIPGIDKDIDGNYFRGTMEELQSLVVTDTQLPPTPPEPEEPPVLIGKVRVLVSQLWARSFPELSPFTQRCIVRKGEEYEIAGKPVPDPDSGITWIPIKVPEQILYVSGGSTYTQKI